MTFVHFPQHAGDYPGRVQRVLELLCCSQHRYAVDRPELARSMGNHARFFAYLALLPLGVRRAMFLDVDTLAHDDVAPLMASPLDEQKFVADADVFNEVLAVKEMSSGSQKEIEWTLWGLCLCVCVSVCLCLSALPSRRPPVVFSLG